MTSMIVSRRNLLATGVCALAGVASLPGSAGATLLGGQNLANEEIVRKWYTAWANKDLDTFNALLADNFTFTSAAGDDHISKSTFKTQCWDTQINFIGHFDLERMTTGHFDAAFGGARRDEEKSRAKERIYSFRDSAGQWDPKNQRPELWNLYNARVHPGESIRVFPLSNWTEMDVWQYIHEEKIPVVDLYFAKERPMYVRGDALLPIEQAFVARLGEQPRMVKSRLRSLGCSPCTGAIRSDADTIPAIIAELINFKVSERANRAIDHDQEGSMEIKKREGYF